MVLQLKTGQPKKWRLDEFMQEWLQTYYTENRAIGADEGDFITAPEVSQMFGELVGLWLVEQYTFLGAPVKFHLVELGPGRGTLMKDILRVLPKNMRQALALHLVEINPFLRKIQAEGLNQEQPQWHDAVEELLGALKADPAPVLLVANEFFDAFPIRQFKRDEGEIWHETYVCYTPNQGWKLEAVPARNMPFTALPEEASIYEHGARACEMLEKLAIYIKQFHGAGLLIDYGGDGQSFSLQAVKNHQNVGLFEFVGEADLTAHVNFNEIQSVLEKVGLSTFGPLNQGVFLKDIGIDVRARQLSEKATNASERADVFASLYRLTSPVQMGTLFKVVGFCSHDEQPSGF